MRSKNPNHPDVNKESKFFVASAVHDLRGHLQLISSGISLLHRRPNDSADFQRSVVLAGIEKEIGQMDYLVTEILQLSKAKEQPLNLELVDLGKVISSSIEDLRATTEDSKITIEVDTLPKICGDKAKLYQVFYNLLHNAVKYRKPDVELRVLVRKEMTPDSHLKSDKVFHHISVEDNGIGVGDEDLKHIFRPFYRAYNPNVPGTGLGLAICKRIIEAHQGTISAKASTGLGTKFTMRLKNLQTCRRSNSCSLALASVDKCCPLLSQNIES